MCRVSLLLLENRPQIPLTIAISFKVVQFKTNPKCCEMLFMTLLVRPSFKFKSLKVLVFCKEKQLSLFLPVMVMIILHNRAGKWDLITCLIKCRIIMSFVTYLLALLLTPSIHLSRCPGVSEVGEGTWSREAPAWPQIHTRTAALHRLCTGKESSQKFPTTLCHYIYMLNHFSHHPQLERLITESR